MSERLASTGRETTYWVQEVKTKAEFSLEERVDEASVSGIEPSSCFLLLLVLSGVTKEQPEAFILELLRSVPRSKNLSVRTAFSFPASRLTLHHQQLLAEDVNRKTKKNQITNDLPDNESGVSCQDVKFTSGWPKMICIKWSVNAGSSSFSFTAFVSDEDLIINITHIKLINYCTLNWFISYKRYLKIFNLFFFSSHNY